jgi:hypothetical protein
MGLARRVAATDHARLSRPGRAELRRPEPSGGAAASAHRWPIALGSEYRGRCQAHPVFQRAPHSETSRMRSKAVDVGDEGLGHRVHQRGRGVVVAAVADEEALHPTAVGPSGLPHVEIESDHRLPATPVVAPLHALGPVRHSQTTEAVAAAASQLGDVLASDQRRCSSTLGGLRRSRSVLAPRTPRRQRPSVITSQVRVVRAGGQQQRVRALGDSSRRWWVSASGSSGASPPRALPPAPCRVTTRRGGPVLSCDGVGTWTSTSGPGPRSSKSNAGRGAAVAAGTDPGAGGRAVIRACRRRPIRAG